MYDRNFVSTRYYICIVVGTYIMCIYAFNIIQVLYESMRQRYIEIDPQISSF